MLPHVTNIGEVHDMRCSASATSKLENLFWESEAAFHFKKFLTQINVAMRELDKTGQPLYPQ